MNEKHDQPGPRGERPRVPVPIFLLLAFFPSIIGVSCLGMMNIPWVLPLLVTLGAICCLLASFGLLRGTDSLAVRVALTILLGAAFFGLNAFIVMFAGCARG